MYPWANVTGRNSIVLLNFKLKYIWDTLFMYNKGVLGCPGVSSGVLGVIRLTPVMH